MPAVIRAILTDIEGTTSSIHFVHQVLFPYSAAALPAFVAANRADRRVASALALVAQELGTSTEPELVAALLQWLGEDRKHPALKLLQGLIWEHGYREGAFKAHVYPEVAERLGHWQRSGLLLYVYSSGSVLAQKLFFGHSEAGDLLGLFSGYFDTSVGHKRDPASYQRVAQSIGLVPGEILFLSDIVEELDAARICGMATVQIQRDGEISATARHPTVQNFNDVVVA